MEDFTQFSKDIKKVNGPRHHKVTKSIGVYDRYKYIRKHKWMNIPRPLTEHEFYTIIRQMNMALCDIIVSGSEVVLPYRMGSLELRKKPARMSIENGKLVTNLPIDWDATLKLWYEDKDALESQTLVKVENEDIFKVCYDKARADYTNMCFYEFKPNRSLKQRITQKAKLGKLDATSFRYYD